MKIKFVKSAIICLIVALMVSFTACTYTANGSVIQDVTFTVSYENTDNEKVEIDATLSLYKTFAPKTTERLISLFKEGFYNDTQVVFNEMGKYLVLGAYTMENNEYKDIIATETIKGEFIKNGFESKLKAQAGSLVMLREPDSGKGTSKYNSAKVTFAILLESVSTINNSIYTVFGTIDETSLGKLTTMRDDLFKDDDGFVKMRYVGERDDKDNKIVENGSYKGSYEFYLNTNDSEYFDKNKEKLDYGTDENVDYADQELYEKLKGAYAFDLLALPIKPISVKNFKIK